MSRQQWGNGYWSGVKDGIKAKLDFKTYCITKYATANREDRSETYAGDGSILEDFVSDLMRDNDFPSMALSENRKGYKKRILFHLTWGCRACEEAIWAFNRLWTEWMEVCR